MRAETRIRKELIRVSIIDDHQVVRSGLKSMLEKEPTVAVVSEFSDGESFLDAFSLMDDVDVLLLDISMPKAGGLEVMERLAQGEEPPAVIILSVHPEESHALQAVIAGARGYLNKQCSRETLIEAITCVAHGGLYFSRRAQTLLFHSNSHKDLLTTDLLSSQELSVFTGLCRGMTTKEIAFTMDVSSKSVSTYKTRLMEKLNAKNLADLIRIGISWGI